MSAPDELTVVHYHRDTGARERTYTIPPPTEPALIAQRIPVHAIAPGVYPIMGGAYGISWEETAGKVGDRHRVQIPLGVDSGKASSAVLLFERARAAFFYALDEEVPS